MPSSKFGSKFLGEERYQQYVEELTAEGTIDGEKLSPSERKEGFKKRNDKIDFQNFVEKVLDKKQSATSSVGSAPQQRTSLGGGRGGAIVRTPKVDPGKIVPQQAGEETKENLDDILKGIDSILESLRNQEKLKENQAKEQRRSAEKQRRKGKEEKLEGGIFKGLAKATNKVLKPVKGLFERIFDFIKTIILGRIIVKLLEWMGNPDNRKKLEAIGRFLKATWPALLAAYLLFGNSLGRFVTRLLVMTAKFIPKIAMTIARLAAANPLAAAAIAGAGLFVAGYAIPKLFPGTVDEQERKTESAPGTVEEKIKALEERKKNLSFTDRLFNVEGEINDQIEFLKTGRAAKYGAAPLQGFSGGGLARGTDTVPAMLTPGEFVMSRGAVQEYGVDTLSSMNAVGGGNNRPRMLGGTVYASGGGHVHGKPTEPAKENRQSAEKQPEVPVDSGEPNRDDFAMGRAGGKAYSEAMRKYKSSQPESSVTPTESIIPKAKKSLIATGAKTTYYDPSLGGINASGAKTADGLPQTSTGEAYRPEVFSAAAFPPLLKLLPGSMTVPARGFPGGRTLKTPFHVLVTKGDKKAIVRVNDVGPGVEGHSPNHMLDLSVAAKDYFGTGEGFRIDFAKGDSKPGPVTGSTDNITASFSGSVSNNAGGELGSTSDYGYSDSNGGGGGESSKVTAADQAKMVSQAQVFDYNQIRQMIGTKTSSISRPSRPSSTAAYQQQMQSQQSSQGQSGYSDEKTGKAVPEINADQMASAQKIQVLGIVV